MKHVPLEMSPPAHLRPQTAAWWRAVADTYVLEPHHYRLLQTACEAWDRAAEAREILARDGVIVLDRFGQRKQHPATLVERDAKGLFMRALRDLGLDAAETPDTNNRS